MKETLASGNPRVSLVVTDIAELLNVCAASSMTSRRDIDECNRTRSGTCIIVQCCVLRSPANGTYVDVKQLGPPFPVARARQGMSAL